MDKQMYRRLNNAIKRANIDEIIHYKNTGEFPNGINTPVKRERYSNSFDQFSINDGNLELNYDNENNVQLLVIYPDEIEEFLQEIYDNHSVALGKGVQKFYDFVSTKVLGLSRKDCEDFLKRQLPYQLTRPTVASRNKMKRYTKPNQMWAMDLIDMSNLAGQNNGWNFILSVIDLYTKRCYLRKIRKKSAVQVRNAFQTIVDGNNNIPKALMFDNGTEFKAEFAVYLNQQNIKIYNSQSHTPIAPIENLNGQIRKIIAELGVRNVNLIWHTHLARIESSLNNNTQNWKAVEKREHEAELQTERDANEPQHTAKFVIGNRVRVSQKAFLSAVREKNKSGHMKEIYVKRGILIYTIRRVLARDLVNGFYSYELNYANGQPVQHLGKILRYREIDLSLVPENTRGVAITPQQSNMLNRI